LNLRRAVLLSVPLLFLALTSTSLAQSPGSQQCSNTPPIVIVNPDQSVTIDLGFCFIFPTAAPYQAYDLTQGFTIRIDNPPRVISSVEMSYSSLTPDMHTGWMVVVCSLACDQVSSPLAFTGSQAESLPAPLPPALVFISEHAWIADYASCWNAGYYCWFSAKLTLR
jgi:hypothetical protein